MDVSAALLGQIALPPYLSISAGILSDDVPPLSPGEQASVAPMAQARLAEFAQGRGHARIALARLGLANASIPVASDRAPVWPQGFVGSICHVPADRARSQCGQVMAVVARSCDCAGLGVDLERTGLLQPEHWRSFLTACELESLASRSVGHRSAIAHAIWSAKEAVMKALRQALDPQDIEIRVDGDGSAFVAECRRAEDPTARRRVKLKGRLASAQGWVLALAMF